MNTRGVSVDRVLEVILEAFRTCGVDTDVYMPGASLGHDLDIDDIGLVEIVIKVEDDLNVELFSDEAMDTFCERGRACGQLTDFVHTICLEVGLSATEEECAAAISERYPSTNIDPWDEIVPSGETEVASRPQ